MGNSVTEKLIEKGIVGLYIAISSVIYMSNCYVLNSSVKYILAFGVFLLTALDFLIRPRFADAKRCLFFFALFYAPYFVFWLWSLVLWIIQMQAVGYIKQGSQNTFYMFAVIAYMVSSYYLFGKKCILYTLASMVIGNAVGFAVRAIGVSIPQLISEYITLVLTLADTTGSAIRKWELHDMAYGWGPMILYFALNLIRKRGKQRLKSLLCLLLCLFFFFGALKRIALGGLVLAAVAMTGYQLLGEKGKKWCALVVGLGATVGIFFYLYTIKTGIFYDFCDAHGIDLQSRDWIYSSYEDFYEISLFYLGRGARFVKAYGQRHPPLFDALHNVFLENYIEVGFVVTLLWLVFELYVRLHILGKRYSWKATSFLFAIYLYMCVTYMSGNTFYYAFSANVTYRMVSMVYCLEVYEAAPKNLLEGSEE